MHDIMNLKEMLLDELSEYGRKGEVNAKNLEAIDTLAHATKNLCKIIEDAEMMEGESSYGRGGNNYYDGSSYARGRGRNARRDRMGRYSSERRGGSNYENYDGGSNYERGGGSNYERGGNSYRGGNNYRRGGGYSRDDAKEEYIENLRQMMEEAPDEKSRMSIQRMIQNMEQE